jgi:UDP-N-acetylmuramoyl-tripeptide--D-alanyl-D-alanine ligase
LTDTVVRGADLSPEQASRFAAGRLAATGTRDISSVVVDSRLVEEGSLFVALPGERVDGHDFIPEAARRGATAVMCRADYWRRNRQRLEGLTGAAGTISVIPVTDTLVGLQRMAKAYVERFPELLKIGITGSNGKTTTKEILGAILALDRATLISEGNLNSEIGLPLSCFGLRREHRTAVFEMAINHAGEMDVLTDIYPPDIAVITNIGTAHIGLLGSREAIAREKKKIFARFDGPQKAFLPESGGFRERLGQGVRGKIVPFGPEETRGFEGSEDLGLDGTIIHWEGLRIRFPLFGAHNLQNALASISVSAELGVDKEKIKEGLESVRPLFGRSQIIRGSVTVIQDCYNANPESFGQVLTFLRALPWPGRKIAVLGAMKELGETSEEAHRRIGNQAAECDFQGLFLFGEEMESAYAELQSRAYKGAAYWMTDIGSLRSSLESYLRQGDLLLIKGSRAVELERITPKLDEG